jgi:hypothetical protein
MMMTEMDIETSVYYVNLTGLIAREDFIKFTRREITKTYKEWVVHITQIISTTLRTRTEMVFETLVSTKLNHLTQLINRENFIIQHNIPYILLLL